MGKSKSLLFFIFIYLTQLIEKLGSYSRQAEIATGTSTPMTFLNRLIRRSTSLKASQRAGLKAYSCSTMRPATKSVHRMPYQHEIWQKVHQLFIFPTTTTAAQQLTPLTGPKNGWTHHPNGPPMRNGTLPNGEPQPFYFAEDHLSMPRWFKGMKIIIRERRLWPEMDLLAQCPGFRCPPGCTDCCSMHSFFTA
jgi:hypothetical protein